MDEKMKAAIIEAINSAYSLAEDRVSNAIDFATAEEFDDWQAEFFAASLLASGFGVSALAAADAVDGEWNAAIEAAVEAAISAELPEGTDCHERWRSGHWHGRRDAAVAIRKLKRPTP